MRKLNTKKIIVVLIISSLLLVYWLKLDALGWYIWHNAETVTDAHALNLKDYQVAIERLAIEGIDNASELTYNRLTDTLFTVLNKGNQIVEISLSGKVLRRINVIGIGDMEGITHIDGNRFVIAGEYDSSLLLVDLDENSSVLDVENVPKIRLGINKNGNKNFEGVSWDYKKKTLLVVKERDPKYVISLDGLVNKAGKGTINLNIERLHQYDNMLDWAMRDLSAVQYLGKSGHLLLLSDESKMLKEFDENANPIGAMLFWKGFHGLKNSVPQAEGVAIDDNNNLYLISEPNLFYVFKPPKKN
jgi:uncharacterized protein YjiK